MTYTHQSLLNDIAAQPAMLRTHLSRWSDEAAALANRLPQSVRRVLITGCGDSYFAGVATALAFDTYARVETAGVQALELARYGLGFAGPDTLVVGISWGGRTSRSREALRLARQRGCATLAITNRVDRPILEDADQGWSLLVDDIEPNVPGVRSYTATVASLYLLAFALGERNGTLDSTCAQAAHRTLTEAAGDLERTFARNVEAIPALLERLPRAPVEIFIGAGPNYGTALYAVGKTQEAGSLNAHSQELEEWAHVQMHSAGREMRPILIAPPGRGRDRVVEIATAMQALHCQTVVVAAEDDDELAMLGHLLPVAGGLPEEFSPLSYSVPVQLYAYAAALAYGPVVRRIAFDAPYRDENHRLILESRLATSYPPEASQPHGVPVAARR